MAKKDTERTKARKKHTNRRAKQRHGFELYNQDQRNVIQLIQSRRGIVLYKQSNTITHFLVRYNERYIVVVYSNLHKTLVTTLPSEEVNRVFNPDTAEKSLTERINRKIQDNICIYISTRKLRLLLAVRIDYQWYLTCYDEIMKTVVNPDID